MKGFFAALTRHPVSLAGTVLTTSAAVLFIALFALELAGMHGGPYVGIIAYLILPGIFVLGLLLIPLGARLERRRRAAGATESAFPVVDLNRAETRNRVILVFALSLVNVLLLAVAMYKGMEVMDSTAFCGQACHSVMSPEFAAYQRGAHASVACVDCHIGPGAGWFVKSKLSGAWQVVSVNLDLYPRPIPTPVHNLRPARDTCEQCHWPQKFVGDRLKVITSYADDEEVSEMKTVLLLRVGGIQGRTSHGIHWHVDPENEIRFRADESRETVYEIEMRGEDGEAVRFFAPGAAEGELAAAGTWRTMDCVDCHNRPSHTFHSAEDEVDRELLSGRIARDLPFVRREGVRLARADYPSHEAAREAILAGLRGFYAEQFPELAATRAEAIAEAAAAIWDGYRANVHPTMNVTWGTYPNHIGHEDTPGCFRCHDDLHATADGGRVVSQDCETCHSLLAMEEEDPEILRVLKP
ncbi:MAG: NapC/NirT family cytochrome c [Thermoanaerobaculia bacterium]|nr:NapC/NirT family cytochrome c [Thermoanaerobaculia bacterium]MCZ7651521.1 NapC/NirT family cytochrome c [Thermoanaerobaculia bacterium]